MLEDPAGSAWDVGCAPELIGTGTGVHRSLVLILQDESKPRLRTTDFSATFLYTAAPEREARICGKLLIELAPRPGLEPGTCGLTVRPVIARKAAPVNDLDQNGR